jgi:D-arabinose 1-dehydrogenase-like Zn-dependent alcohol dehydrogenase
MLTAIYRGPEGLHVEELPTPTVGADDALLRVVSAGTCGTDLQTYRSHRQYPSGTVRIPGHEVVGNIVHVGLNVTGMETGTRRPSQTPAGWT